MPAVTAANTTIPLSNVSPFRARSTLRDVSLGSTCKLREACLPVRVNADAMTDLEDGLTMRTRVGRQKTLYRAGDRFAMLYLIRAGSFKTILLSPDGREQVADYHMSGELLGSDGIGLGVHDCAVVALEDSEVCSISFVSLEKVGRLQEWVEQNLHRVLARQIVREHRVMMILGAKNAEQRLAMYLLDLSERYAALGYSSTEFVLKMTRSEIASYVGLKLETISRMLSRFHREGLIHVQGRVVKLLDPLILKQLLEHSS